MNIPRFSPRRDTTRARTLTDNIPFLDLGAVFASARDEIVDAMTRVLDSGWYILGNEVTSFEAAYADYCGAKACVGVANGLDALELALLAMGVGEGDEVIVPSNTYIATWLAVSHAGAVPVPVEPDATYNIDQARIEAAITSRTKVILPVHLYGQAADMTAILNIARRHGLRVLEDGAMGSGWGRMAMRSPGASIPARTSARWATAERSPPTTLKSPTGCGCCATMVRGSNITTRSSVSTAGSTSCRLRSWQFG